MQANIFEFVKWFFDKFKTKADETYASKTDLSDKFNGSQLNSVSEIESVLVGLNTITQKNTELYYTMTGSDIGLISDISHTSTSDSVTAKFNGVKYDTNSHLQVISDYTLGSWEMPMASTSSAGMVTSTQVQKLNAIEEYTIGEGLTVENGVLKCNFTPTRYYTGSSTPTDDTGNNGDLYLQITS